MGKSLGGNVPDIGPWRWYMEVKVYEAEGKGRWRSFSTEVGTPKGLGAWHGTDASRPASAVDARTMRAGEARGVGR